jgi:hypothetical protein
LGELIIFTHAGGSKDYQVDRVIHYPGVVPAAVPVAGISETAARLKEPQNTFNVALPSQLPTAKLTT